MDEESASVKQLDGSPKEQPKEYRIWGLVK